MVSLYDMSDDSTQEILGAIRDIANQTKSRLDSFESELRTMKSDLEVIKSGLGPTESDISTMNFHMVTKEYLDDRLSNLRTDLTNQIRTGNS
jgi:hypothetical protein